MSLGLPCHRPTEPRSWVHHRGLPQPPLPVLAPVLAMVLVLVLVLGQGMSRRMTMWALWSR